ncbi:16S rRNA (cytidine(1402)-2'-O)-methyltransferase [Bacillus suaedaesalsae]|uniref:Ribosomal RNA small subunit methyltransferase I n=1 Tax=Bacillus suaedaesalsae TaxID=2810349 RepID=A0ABS2DDV4_9BACI|nr:16S rRNA (cytidine(1402)-2'-O)-methyltransferase [Bacillus suaedaesalsae]MBM6616215.1 16S rRNA (cytidine(1402)-2'-O)-methyltransferase [Bacillus suaedaesalsae]
MWQQKSFSNEDIGVLYVVATPIGNLEDMTYRAIRILKEADIIAAEDTRVSKKLCNYFEIHTPVVSYHEHNKVKSGDKLLADLQQGKTIALVSDAGMPTISDPGYELVCLALEHRIPVIPLPGANAALTALVASGLPPQNFYFYGFLPRQKKEKKEELDKLKRYPATIMFYESPHRLKDTLKAMAEILGNRNVVISRELTKKFEEFIRGTAEELAEWLETTEVKGECCILVKGSDPSEVVAENDWWENLSINDHVEHYMNQEMSSKDAIKQVAVERKLPKRDVYESYHIK